jgi:serine/threonine protein kinase
MTLSGLGAAPKGYAVLGRIARGSTAEVLLAIPLSPPSSLTSAPSDASWADDGSAPQGTTGGMRSGRERVVLKRLYPHLASDEEFVRMFIDEVRLMSLVRHPGVVGVVDLDEDGETLFSVLELVDGPSLAGALRILSSSGRAFPVETAVVVAARVASALATVHALVEPTTREPLTLVHRDVTPHNILLGRGAHPAGVVKLADFGVAWSAVGRRSGFLSARDTQAGLKKGRATALAPEQVLGRRVDARTDLWQLGITLWTMLAGAPPFVGENHADLFSTIVTAPTPRLRAVRRDLDAVLGSQRAAALEGIVDDLLQKEAAHRPAHAGVIAERLHSVLEGCGPVDDVASLVASLHLPSLHG